MLLGSSTAAMFYSEVTILNEILPDPSHMAKKCTLPILKKVNEFVNKNRFQIIGSVFHRNSSNHMLQNDILQQHTVSVNSTAPRNNCVQECTMEAGDRFKMFWGWLNYRQMYITAGPVRMN